MTMQYPVQIQVQKEGNRFTVKATTSVEKVTREAQNPEQELRGIELDCSLTLTTAREAIDVGGRGKRHDPRAYWLAAKALADFLDRLRQSGFYLVNQNKTLGSALDSSDSSVKKLLAFYRRFPELRLVDPTIPWKKYRDNQVPRKQEMGRQGRDALHT